MTTLEMYNKSFLMMYVTCQRYIEKMIAAYSQI